MCTSYSEVFSHIVTFRTLACSDIFNNGSNNRLSLKRGFGRCRHGFGGYDVLGGLGGLSGLGEFGGFDGLGGFDGFGGFSGFDGFSGFGGFVF